MLGLILLGVVLIAFFGFRSYVHYQHLAKMEASGFAVESLRGWMTMPYISKRYDVSEQALFDAIGIEVAENKSYSLRQLIEIYQLDNVATRHAIERLIEERQAGLPGAEKAQ